MSSEAQIAANRENARHSTGPTTEEGKAASSQNNHRHGLAGGIFYVLPWEDQDTYLHLLDDLFVQHQPQTYFEESLVQKIAQHFWLSQRAVELQQRCFHREAPLADMPVSLELYMRYQAIHDRAYLKYSDELRKLRNEARKQRKEEAALVSEPKIQAIGFESQKAAETRRAAAEQRRQSEESRKQAAEIRREANELRRSELHLKRLAVLDAQIARLTPAAPAPTPSKSGPAKTVSEPKTPNWGSQAA